MNTAIRTLERFPFYIILLPLFFFLHSLADNFQDSLISTAAELTLLYTAAGVVLAAIFRIFIKKWLPACLLSFFLLAFNFFFGSVQDFFKDTLGNSLLTRYRFIIPAVLITTFVLFYYLKKSGKNFFRITLFLNVIFILFILVDFYNLLNTELKKSPLKIADRPQQFTSCDTCGKPDIYIIIADEYAGKQTLTDIFGFDNSAFEDNLKLRGFHIVNNTRSNYNSTVFSMASMFNMSYIENLRDSVLNHFDMFRCRSLIKKNSFQSFLKLNSYKSYTFSTFEWENQKNIIHTPFFITKKDFFTGQTFTSRLKNQTGFNFYPESEIEKWRLVHHLNNTRVLAETKKAILLKSDRPKFVYSHLMLPHCPYYFDQEGNRTFFEKIDSSNLNKEAYIGYLLYTNKILTDLVDYINTHSERPPIILLMSDHGFKQFSDKSYLPYHFKNFVALLLPDRNYKPFYDGLTNINLLRILLASQFNQKLDLLEDRFQAITEP